MAYDIYDATVPSLIHMLGSLSNVLSQGMGDLINADTEADSARLAALTVQQQLGEQSLNVANSMPSVLLSLFR